MQRVIVAGCPGAGKSTFARRLHALTGLPLYYLDRLWHKSDGSSVSREEFDVRLHELLKRDAWIIDGNYQRTLKPRLQACDTLFLLDYPLEVCLEGARERIGKPREDMPWVESELDEEFRQYILNFPAQQLPGLYALREQYKDSVDTIVFTAREQAERYLEALSSK